MRKSVKCSLKWQIHIKILNLLKNVKFTKNTNNNVLMIHIKMIMEFT